MEKKEIMKSFLDELKANKELAEKFLAQKDSIEGAYSVAKPYISGMSKDDFLIEMEMLAQEILEGGEISLDDLESISGGGKLKTAGKIIGLGYAGIALVGVALHMYEGYRITRTVDKWLEKKLR